MPQNIIHLNAISAEEMTSKALCIFHIIKSAFAAKVELESTEVSYTFYKILSLVAGSSKVA